MKRILAFTVTCSVFAADAFACGVCVTAAFDLFMPPVVLWMVISITWFVSNGILRSVTGALLPLQPAAFGAVTIAVVAFLLAGAAAGPLTILPLAIPPAYAFIRSLAGNRSSEAGLRVIGFIHVVAIVVAGVLTVHTLNTRTDAQFITRWAGSAIGRAKFARLRASEPTSLQTYREIAASEDGYMAAEAAERIGEIGQPAVDIPLLERALAKFAKDSDTRAKISAALLRLRTRRAPANSA